MKQVIRAGYSKPGVLSAVRSIRQFGRREHRAVIVNFHQFHDGSSSLLRKGPSVHTNVATLDHFLRRILDRYAVISLTTLVDHLKHNVSLKEDAIAITIDDGYRNNLDLGLPVFRRHGVPVTLFVATGFIGTHRMLPMEEVSFLLRVSPIARLTSSLLGGAQVALNSNEQRRVANTRLGNALKELPPQEIRSVLDELADQLQVNLADAPRQMLNWDEVRRLHKAGVEIGSHAISHSIMTRLSDEAAREELAQSKNMIETKLDTTVKHFAFPNGRDIDFSDSLRKIAKEVGYESVASVRRGACIPGKTDPLDLNRVGLIGDVAETMFFIERLMWRRGGMLPEISL